MTANGTPDPQGRILAPRSVQLKDKYLVADPLTESVATYKPYRPLVVPTGDCGGVSDAPILGHPTEVVDQHINNKGGQTRFKVTKWLAVDLNCISLRERAIDQTKSGPLEIDREAVSVVRGEPPDEYFTVPAHFKERGPKEMDDEGARRHPGQRVFGNSEAVDALEKVYQSDQPQ
jgi:hypothetical protein